MDTSVKIITMLLACMLMSKPRKFFYSSWNIGYETFSAARFGLYVVYVLCLCVFFAICLFAQDPFSVLIADNWKSILPTADMSVLSTAFVTSVCLIDANYRASRRQGFEKNLLKHWVFQGLSVFPIVFCLLVNRILILVAGVVYISGIFYKPKSQSK